MNVIEVDVGKTKLFSIGQQYNDNALAIHFVNLPNLRNKFIYYQVDDIEHEIPLVDDLFIVSRPLTLHSGEVKAQIITRDDNNSVVELTNNFTMRIKPSNYSGIGEDENYPDDPNIKNYFVKIDEKVNSFEELANLVQTKLDNGEFVGAQGPKGEKGDPGDVTEEYRNLASQIAQNASDAQISATNAQTSASNAQKAFNDTKDFANQTKSEMNQIKTDTNTLKDEANTSAVNAKDSETKAKEYADNLQASTDDISQLKEDLANKLPKSPTKWGPWTEDEKADARERIGLRNLKLISELTVSEDVELFSIDGLDLNRILIDIELSNLPSSGVTAQIYIKTQVNNLVYIGRIHQASGNRRIIINAEYVKSFIVVSSIFSNTPNNANSIVSSSPPIYCDNCDNIKGFMLTFTLYAGSKIKVFGGV